MPRSRARSTATRLDLPAVKIVQVIHVCDEKAVDRALRAAGRADALLLDSGNPALAVKELGGTGRVHDWRLSRRIVEQSPVPVILAGGLHAGNVRAAIEQVRPFAVDVCSGVRSNGRLDPRKRSPARPGCAGTAEIQLGLVAEMQYKKLLLAVPGSALAMETTPSRCRIPEVFVVSWGMAGRHLSPATSPPWMTSILIALSGWLPGVGARKNVVPLVGDRHPPCSAGNSPR